MWSRENIKDYAKKFLSDHYWKAFIVCLIVMIICGSGSQSGSGSQVSYSLDYQINGQKNIAIESTNIVFNTIMKRVDKTPLLYVSISTVVIFIILLFILMITVGYSIEVGKNRFFLKGFDEDVSIKYLFSTFNSQEYIAIVKTQFLRGLYNFLWFLLFIIPGIIKSYEYRMVPYILSDNPNLPSNEVISRSSEMTQGHKWNMFILDLSFIGWYLLGLLLCGIGGIFVKPYVEATYARLYNILSGKDLDTLISY